MSSIEIRPTRPDEPRVQALLAALDAYLGSLYAPEANHILDVQALRALEITFLAAWRDDTPVACAAVRRMPGEAETAGAAYGEIKRMYVRPELRGQRIAERMLQALEDGLVRQGITRALLETGSEQREAVRLYERTGYVRRAAFGGYPDNGLSVFYEKQLVA